MCCVCVCGVPSQATMFACTLRRILLPFRFYLRYSWNALAGGIPVHRAPHTTRAVTLSMAVHLITYWSNEGDRRRVTHTHKQILITMTSHSQPSYILVYGIYTHVECHYHSGYASITLLCVDGNANTLLRFVPGKTIRMSDAMPIARRPRATSSNPNNNKNVW